MNQLSAITGPFILLDDASGGQDARLYSAPKAIIKAHNAPQLDTALQAIDRARTGDGGQDTPCHLAGYFSYEAGLALEPRLQHRLERYLAEKPSDASPLCWFGVFDTYDIVPAQQVDDWLAQQCFARNGAQNTGFDGASFEGGGFETGGAHAQTGRYATADNVDRYTEQFANIIAAIESGDIYQANLTIRAHAHFNGCPIALYRQLRAHGAAKYSALLYDGTHWQLSLSPELFFACQNGRITTRPMKGTLPAKPHHAGDKRAARDYFAHDAKNRAENLMIVDLLRNDLSRICVPGSVTAKDLFTVEHYPTVHQMVSTITGQMQSDIAPSDIISALFPCGSITGAPKIRAMELIDAIETSARNIYCGAIGRIDAAQQHDAPESGAGSVFISGSGQHDGDRAAPVSAAFNVAIRTLHFAPQSQRLTLGLGSGVVADSDRETEWRECLDKGAFAMTAARQVDLIETMALYPDTGVQRLEAHLARMKASAQQLAYEFDRHAARNAIQAACFHAVSPAKIRLLVSRSGNFAIQSSPLHDLGQQPVRAILADMPVAPDDPRLAHKTTDRRFYDDARKQAKAAYDAAEIIFVDSAGYATEGSFTHIFVRRDDNDSAGDAAQYYTPPLSRGILPGILRAEMIDNGSAAEADVTRDELLAASASGRLFLGNSVRGLFAAQLD